MLSPQENLDLINEFSIQASKALESEDFITKVGGLTIFAGVLDFLSIQIARTVEQVIIKEAILNNKPIPLKDAGAPHEDIWFYENKISTRRILKQVYSYGSKISAYPNISKNIYDLCKSGEDFLNHRITVIHFVGNPKISKEKMIESVKGATDAYNKFYDNFKIFRIKILPFTFSDKEKEYFYGNDKDRGIIVI